ncbi:unnamed protein product [Prorocentrum cordatum]|uniref:General transcription factor IIH subunit 4 n=1 Tax=Prorocentrum cordatum TaxID=2364126 RepID=A0ABN9TYX3_9DINO|nr:unnamed protein product [Polarella glacialis]
MRVPLEVAKRLGTLHAGSVIPPKRSSRGGLIKKNLDLASWNVGKCSETLTLLVAALYDHEGLVQAREVETLCDCTSAKHLLYNHVWSALRFSGLFDVEGAVVDPAKEGTNSAKIRRLLFAGDSWSITLGRVKAEIARLGHPRLAENLGPMELNALACQFLRVLRNFVFPLARSGWRDPSMAPVMAGRWQRFLDRCRPARVSVI